MTGYMVELSPEHEATLKKQAEAQGMRLEEWLRRIAEMHAAPVSEAHLQRTDPEEWARRFHQWAESHDRTTPLLSDEAISRDSIYPDPV